MFAGVDWERLLREPKSFGCSVLLSCPEVYGQNGLGGRLQRAFQGAAGCVASYRVSELDSGFISGSMDGGLVPPSYLSELESNCCYNCALTTKLGMPLCKFGLDSPSGALVRCGFWIENAGSCCVAFSGTTGNKVPRPKWHYRMLQPSPSAHAVPRTGTSLFRYADCCDKRSPKLMVR